LCPREAHDRNRKWGASKIEVSTACDAGWRAKVEEMEAQDHAGVEEADDAV
jgi:hypothetical protein